MRQEQRLIQAGPLSILELSGRDLQGADGVTWEQGSDGGREPTKGLEQGIEGLGGRGSALGGSKMIPLRAWGGMDWDRGAESLGGVWEEVQVKEGDPKEGGFW